MPTHEKLHTAYLNVKLASARDLGGAETHAAIRDLAKLSLDFLLTNAHRVELISRVRGKSYISYKIQKIVARPANVDYFIGDLDTFLELWEQWDSGRLHDFDLHRLLYTTALSPCLAMELFDRQNKKGPATYFECLIGHIFSHHLNSQPRKNATLNVDGRELRLTMDFLFPESEHRKNIHLPVKMSTRERVVQAWSHQRLLDSAYGEGAYVGIMVLFSETKLDSRSLEVVEICVPDQWLVYQRHLSKMTRIYYFDLPDRYKQLTEQYPTLINISNFVNMFSEIDVVARN